MAGVFEAGDFPAAIRALLPETEGLECIQSTLGTRYADGFTEKRWDFADGTQIHEYRDELHISNAAGCYIFVLPEFL